MAVALYRSASRAKPAIALLVTALHAVLIAWMLHATISSRPAEMPLKETTVFFVPAPHPKVELPREKAKPSARHEQKLSPRVFDYPPVTAQQPPATGGAGLEGLHAFLFDCALENLANLTPEQRAQCAGTAPKSNDSVDYADHADRSHNAARWARGLARKQQPLLLPCMSPQGFNPLGTLMCLGNGLKNGIDVDAQPGYGDKPQEVHVPNGGDPPDGPRR